MLMNCPTATQQSQTTLQTEIQSWVTQARSHPQGSYARNHYLTRIIRQVSPKLWKVNTPYYPDALQQTWMYFAKNVCTIYDPERASISTWLNVYLRYRHHDLLNRAMNQDKRTLSIDSHSTETGKRSLKVIQEVPSKDYGSLALLEQVMTWVETDADQRLRRTHLRGRPDINCQTLILLRLPPETTWKNISANFDVPIPTLSAFFQRRCLPYLCEFGRAEGICNEPTNEP